jgi:hypothetical protein
MSKFISTVILAAFTAVFSLGATAGSHDSDKKTTGNSPEKWKKEYGDSGKGNDSTSEIMQNETPKDVPADRKAEFRDQEVMNKKPYKQEK